MTDECPVCEGERWVMPMGSRTRPYNEQARAIEAKADADGRALKYARFIIKPCQRCSP
jgi:hypothetical protein